MVDKKKDDKTAFFEILYSLQFVKSSPEFSEQILSQICSLLSNRNIKSLNQGWKFVTSICKDVLKWTSKKHRTLIKTKIFMVFLY